MPKFKTYSEIADFRDKHSLADYWEQTGPASFRISSDARRRYLVPLDRSLIGRVQMVARKRGISTESLVNLFLEQRLHEAEKSRS
ncbi:MAG: hypothetical protein JW768_15560 [Chitinispirillaceae bacterium]|nr:hypothetical protein [Chitinispirillaceae bacterium]